MAWANALLSECAGFDLTSVHLARLLSYFRKDLQGGMLRRWAEVPDKDMKTAMRADPKITR